MASICTVKRILLLKQHFCFSYSPCCCCCLFVSHTFLVCEINGSYENTHIHIWMYIYTAVTWRVASTHIAVTVSCNQMMSTFVCHLRCMLLFVVICVLSVIIFVSSPLSLVLLPFFRFLFFFFGFFRFPTELSAIIFATATATVATGGVTMSHIQILMLLHVFTCLHICMCVCVHRCSVPVFTWWVPLTSASGGLKASFQLTKWLCAVTLP